MSDTIRSTDYFLNASTGALKDNTSGAITAQVARDLLLSVYRPQIQNGFRPTLASGTPVPTTDLIGQSTLYLTPHLHDCIGLYDGTSWTLYQSSELSLALSGLTSGKNYDVVAYISSGAVAIDLLPAWTNDTTRANGISQLNGVWTNSGSVTTLINGVTLAAGKGRVVGTIRATGATTTEDSALNRFVFSQSNRVQRQLFSQDLTNSWTYSSAAWRAQNNSNSNRVNVLAGNSDVWMNLAGVASAQIMNSSSYPACGICEDATNDNTALVSSRADGLGGGFLELQMGSKIEKALPLGFHFYQAVEYVDGGVSCTFIGKDSSGANRFKTGLLGYVIC